MNNQHSKPINITARRVIQKGYSFEFDIKDTNKFHSENQPKIRKIKKEVWNPEFIDFTGYKHGRFNVIGLYEKSKNNHSCWVCKCQCGDYELRTSKSIKRHLKYKEIHKWRDDMCILCESNEKNKKKLSAKSMNLSIQEYYNKFDPPRKKIDIHESK